MPIFIEIYVPGYLFSQKYVHPGVHIYNKYRHPLVKIHPPLHHCLANDKSTIAIASTYIQVTVVTLYLHVVTTAEQVVLVITSICCIAMELMLA